jgi:hypothetical protein
LALDAAGLAAAFVCGPDAAPSETVTATSDAIVRKRDACILKPPETFVIRYLGLGIRD